MFERDGSTTSGSPSPTRRRSSRCVTVCSQWVPRAASIRRLGPMLSVRFHDPEGFEGEINCFDPAYDPSTVRDEDEIVDPAWLERIKHVLQHQRPLSKERTMTSRLPAPRDRGPSLTVLAATVAMSATAAARRDRKAHRADGDAGAANPRGAGRPRRRRQGPSSNTTSSWSACSTPGDAVERDRPRYGREGPARVDGMCSPPRPRPSSARRGAAVPASGAVAVEVDLALAAGTVPARLTNRIVFTDRPRRLHALLQAPPR